MLYRPCSEFDDVFDTAHDQSKHFMRHGYAAGQVAACITTNGKIKSNGCAVMGKGVALDADRRYHVSGRLANYLRLYGNRCFDLGFYDKNGNERDESDTEPGIIRLISFPTKEDWRNPSIPDLIHKSAIQLDRILTARDVKRCYMTPPGCGCGGLVLDDVMPLLAPIDNNRYDVYIITK